MLELVEGPTLAERLAQGRMPLEAALATAHQIATASMRRMRTASSIAT